MIDRPMSHTIELTTEELWDLVRSLNLAYHTTNGALKPRLLRLFGEIGLLERLQKIENLRDKCIAITDAKGWT